MTPAAVNLATKWLVITPWLLWAVWEVALLVLRAKVGPEVKTISMEAKDLGSGGLTALVYFWFGLGAHYWLNWTRPVWSFPWLGVAFWVVGLAFLGTDLFTSWRPELWPEWMRWVRYPPLVAAFAVLMGWACFPQGGSWTP